MMEINTLIAFLGWCSVINIGVLVFSVLIIILMKDSISNIHSKLFGINEERLPEIYFRYLGGYKIAIIILNIVPYFALKIMF